MIGGRAAGWKNEPVHIALTILAIALTVLGVTALAGKIRFSAPLLLMLVGIGISFVPFVDEPRLSPEVVLVGFLPPLLYAAAIRTSLIDFRANLRPIGYLSVLLVVVTALGIGLITWLLLPVSFVVAFALGAVVAPPDAVAATSIARRVGLPRQMITVLEGESLVNDATAITCLRVAITAIAATGGALSAGEVAVGFLIAAFGGAAVGVAVAVIAVQIRKRVQDPVFDTAISLILPFAAYLPAEFIGPAPFHGSGVIAVVTAGLILGHKSPVIQSGQSRLSERVNWSTIQFLLENTVFLLIGLQARRLVEAMIRSEISGARITVFCLAVLVGVIVLRMFWVALGRAFLFRRRDDRGLRQPWSHVLVIGWAGLRGVVTLAAAFLIPVEVEQRDLLIFAALVVTAGTLLLQGLTLPWLVRRLNIRGPDARSDALQAATVLQTASQAALAELDRITTDDDAPETVALVRERITSRSDALWEQLGRRDSEAPAQQYRRLRLSTLQAERDEVLRMRSTGNVDQDVLAEVLATFDMEESVLTVATSRSDRLVEDQVVPTPSGPVEPCDHLLDAPADVETSGSDTCRDCVREGTRTVHLRVCLSCGNVGCCDSSVGRHAERHHATSDHPVMRSFEPNESWRWCYVDARIG